MNMKDVERENVDRTELAQDMAGFSEHSDK
jgi:hypothetical protein